MAAKSPARRPRPPPPRPPPRTPRERWLRRARAVLVVTIVCWVALRPIRIREGNFGLSRGITSQIYDRVPLGPGLHFKPYDLTREYRGREIVLSIENIHPKDKDNVLLQDLDLVVTYTVAPTKAVDFLVKTSDVAVQGGDRALVLGTVRVERTARQVIGRSMRHFGSVELLGDARPLERRFHDDLQAELDAEFGAGTLVVVDVKAANIRVADLVEQRVQGIALVEAERSRNAAVGAVLESRRQLLEAEGRMLREAADAGGITVEQLVRAEAIRALREQVPAAAQSPTRK